MADQNHEIDELIASIQSELEASDARMAEKTPKAPVKQEPAFQPELPREYAELKLEHQKPAKAPKKEEPPKQELSAGPKTFFYVACVLLVSALLAGFIWICADDVCALTRTEKLVDVTVPEGASISEVADILKDADLIEQKWLFKIYCKASHAENKIVPGTYELNTIFDYHALVNGMASYGKRATTTVTIPEGFECRDIFALLEERGVCSQQALWDAAAQTEFDYKFLQNAPMGEKTRLEGFLFPDTYEFYVDDDAPNVLNKFLSNMDRKLDEELWAQLDVLNEELHRKGHGSDLTMRDVITVASLVEKEAANSKEAGTIASVIYNRLCSSDYPYLNIDATIQYVLPERKELLTEEDTQIDSPYNTYKNAGLPAGPIANPGLMAIRGALFPQDTNYFFYALDRDGTHHFTATYDQHLAFLEALKNE